VETRSFQKCLPKLFMHLRSQPIEFVLFLCASLSVVALILMLLFVVMEGSLAFTRLGTQLILGLRWETNSDLYGGFPLIYGSLMVVSGAFLIAVPLGVCTSIFIAEVLPFQLRDSIKSVLELLASIPSVIYGFIGVTFLTPLVASIFGLQSGATALTASLILAIMALPTIVGVSGETISAVPSEYKEAAFAHSQPALDRNRNCEVGAIYHERASRGNARDDRGYHIPSAWSRRGCQSNRCFSRHLLGGVCSERKADAYHRPSNQQSGRRPIDSDRPIRLYILLPTSRTRSIPRSRLVNLSSDDTSHSY